MDDFKSQPAAAPPKPPLGPPIRSARSRKLQFSLRSMLIATAAFAVVGLIGHDVVELVTLLVILCMLPVAVGTLAVYCRGERRTFFGGAVAGLLLLLPFADSAYRSWFGGLIPSIVLEVAAITVGGFTARYVRRFAAARGWDRESDAG